MAQSVGISSGELYGLSAESPATLWNGVSQGLAGLAAAFRGVEQQRLANNRDVGLDAFISALETRGQDVASDRRRDAGYAAGGLLLERDNTSYLANLAKSDVSIQAEKFAQAKIAMGRETAAKNFMAQTTLTPYMDYVTNSASHAGRALAVEAIRSSPVFSDTSAAFKNSLQRVNEMVIQAGDGKKYNVIMDLNGGPATYQAMASTILDERADPETKVNAAASLIMLSTAIGDAIPDSELARFVTPDVLQCAKARVAAFTRLGVDATTMGFMSDRGMERLDGVVRNAENALANLGYTVDADNIIHPANDATREAYERAVAEAKGEKGTVTFSDSVMLAAQGVTQARNQRRDTQKLWDGVQTLGPAEFKAAWEQGNLPALSAFSQAIPAQVASGVLSWEDADKLTQSAQYHIGKAASTWDINRDRVRLGDDLVSSYGFSDEFRANPHGFRWAISPTGDDKEINAALGQAWVSLRSELNLGGDMKLKDLTDPRMINRVAGRAAAIQLVKTSPVVRKAFVGVGGLPAPDYEADEAAAIKLIGDKIGERLNDRLNNESVYYSVDGNGNRTWRLLGGKASGGFDGVVRSVVADAVADAANTQYLEHEARLSETYQRVGVSLTGTENRAPRYMLATFERDGALTPANSKVEAADPVAPLQMTRMLKHAEKNPGESVLHLPAMSVDSDEEVEKVNKELTGAYAYKVSVWEGDNYVTKRPVWPQGAPMPGVLFGDPDAPEEGRPGIFFGKVPDPSERVGGWDGPLLRAVEFSPAYGVGKSHTYIPSCSVMAAGYLKDEPQADIAFYGDGHRLTELTPDMVFTESQLAAGRQIMEEIAPAISKIYESAYSAEISGGRAADPWGRTPTSLSLTAGMPLMEQYKFAEAGAAPGPAQSHVMGNLLSLGYAVYRLPELSVDDPSLGVVRRELQVKLGEAFVTALAQLLDVGTRALGSESFDSARVTDEVAEAIKSADITGSLDRLAAAAGLPADWLDQLRALNLTKYTDEYKKQKGLVEGGFFLAFLHDLGASYVPPSISVDKKISPADLTMLIHRGMGAGGASGSVSASGGLSGVSVYPGAAVNLSSQATAGQGAGAPVVPNVMGTGGGVPPNGSKPTMVNSNKKNGK